MASQGRFAAHYTYQSNGMVAIRSTINQVRRYRLAINRYDMMSCNNRTQASTPSQKHRQRSSFWRRNTGIDAHLPVVHVASEEVEHNIEHEEKIRTEAEYGKW